MARRRKARRGASRGPSVAQRARQAQRITEQLLQASEVARKPRTYKWETANNFVYPLKVYSKRGTFVKNRLSLKAKRMTLGSSPRQKALAFAQLREATVRARQVADGRPVGRRTRQKLQGLVPETLRQALCKPTRNRREVMFATGAAGKGKTAAARRPQSSKRVCR